VRLTVDGKMLKTKEMAEMFDPLIATDPLEGLA
jgi:hypothetical protein